MKPRIDSVLAATYTFQSDLLNLAAGQHEEREKAKAKLKKIRGDGALRST